MPGTAAKIIVSERQQVLLKEFSKSRTVGKCVSQRATIILLGFAGAVQRGDRPAGRPQPACRWASGVSGGGTPGMRCACGNVPNPTVCVRRSSTCSPTPRDRAPRRRSPPSRCPRSWRWRASRRSCRAGRSTTGRSGNCATRRSSGRSWRLFPCRRSAASCSRPPCSRTARKCGSTPRRRIPRSSRPRSKTCAEPTSRRRRRRRPTARTR